MSTQPHRRYLQIALGIGLLFCAETRTAEAQAAPATSADGVPGAWSLEVTTSESTFACTLHLNVNATALTGALDCPQGSVSVEGRSDGNHFAIGFQIVTGDSIFYDGTVARDSVFGTWRQPGLNGPFRGSRNSRTPSLVLSDAVAIAARDATPGMTQELVAVVERPNGRARRSTVDWDWG